MRRLLPRLTAFLLLVLGFIPATAFGAAKKATQQTQAMARKTTDAAQFRMRRLVRVALSQLGVSYRYGGFSPATGFDCSGFTRWVYEHIGMALPHSSYAQFQIGRRVSRERLRPGDLVFFDGVGHVGIYIGAGRFIHAPHAGTVVQVASLNAAGYRYAGARRPGY
jgi:cell wall-associated NlpC family hydrolase